MARHAIRLNTISSRFTLIVSVAVIGCMLLIQMTFYSILRTTLEDHGRSTMQVANESIEMTLENNYNSLLQISQLMDTSGMIGHEFIQFMQAESYMQKHDTMLSVDELLTTATFSAGSNLAIYYDTVLDLNYLSGYQPVKTSFRPAQLPAIQQTGLLIFHAVHASQSRFSNIPVVSLLRGTPSSANKDLAVYVEKPVDLDMLVDEYRKSYGYDLIFLQLDDSGAVLYSSSDAVPAGTQLTDIAESAELFGRWEEYFWSRRVGKFGAPSVLLASQASIYRSVDLQLRHFLLAVLLSAVMIAVAVFLLNQLVIKKNRILQQEIQRVGEGNLSKVANRTGLYDYDQLLDRFDWMIEQLHAQMCAVEAAERRNSEVERTILYYQINPHFLLNSLNSAYWQAKMNIPGGTDQYIAQLTGILRYSLGKDTAQPTLRKEVEILRLYLQLQEKRYDFTYALQVEDGAYLDMATPRLFIQPIVENSIEHGLDIGDHIDIRVCREGGWACVHVQDNGVGMSAQTLEQIERNMDAHDSSAGIGLRYVKTVLSAMFGDRAQIHIESTVGGGTRVTLRLPIDPAPQEREQNAGGSSK